MELLRLEHTILIYSHVQQYKETVFIKMFDIWIVKNIVMVHGHIIFAFLVVAKQ